MLLAAGEKALPALLARRAGRLLCEGMGELVLQSGAIVWESRPLASVTMPPDFSAPQLTMERETGMQAELAHKALEQGLKAWLAARLEPLVAFLDLARAATGTQGRAAPHTDPHTPKTQTKSRT